MAYEQTSLVEPYFEDEDQDMWLAEISYYPVDGEPDSIRHEDCIEVRAENKDKLMMRVNIIVSALNDHLVTTYLSGDERNDSDS